MDVSHPADVSFSGAGASPMIGRRVSHYRIVEKIGEGGMGEVFLAEDERLRRKVALKFLPADLTRDEERRRRFLQEARAAAAIEHPHVAAIHDVDEADGRTFIAMEYVPGASLRDCLGVGALGLRRSVELGLRIAEGLAKAHDHGVVHRDLKPENVIVSEEGYPKIIDFGLARLLEPLSAGSLEGTNAPTHTRLETREGLVLGTVPYMSPEQARGETVDGRSDIFSFGVLLYEMLTGTSPFRRASVIESLNAVLQDAPPPPSEKGVEAPNELERILRKTLAKEKSERYQSMKDVVLDLREVRDELASGARRRAARPASRVVWPWVVSAAAFALAFAGFVFYGRQAAPAGIGASGRPAIAVLYFENNTADEEIRWLSRGLPSMLLTDLAQTPGLDVVSSERVHEILKLIGQENAEAIDRGIASEVARRSGAGAVVVGSIFKSGDEIRIDVQVEDVASGRLLSAQSVRGTDVFPLVDELTERIRVGLRMTDAPATPRLAEVATASLEAYRVYSEALDARRNLRYADARRLLERTIQIDPSFALAHFELARVAQQFVQTPIAEAHMARVLENLNRLPERERILVQAIHARRSERDPKKASELLEALLEKYPDEEDAYSDLSSAYQQLGRPQDSLRVLERGVAALPRSGSIRNAYGYELMRHGMYEEGLRAFEAYARSLPDEPNPYDSMGEIHLLLGELEEAIESYGHALEIDPTFANAHGGRAWAYAMMGRYEEALRESDRMGKVTAQTHLPLANHHFRQAFLLSRLGRYAEAEDEQLRGVKLALEADQQVMAVGHHILRALLLLERGDLDRAFESVRRVEEALPRVSNAEIREEQTVAIDSFAGIAFARSNRLQEARTRLERIKWACDGSSLPSRWYCHALAGEIALKEGDLTKAEEAYRSGIPGPKAFFNLGTPPPTTLLQHSPFRDGLARIRRARGDLGGAIEAYRDLNRPGPENKWTSWLEPRFILETARLLREIGDGDAARAEYARFLELWSDADRDLPELKEARSYLGS